MSFAGGRDGSKGFMKRVTSTFSIKKNNKNTTNDPKPLLPRSRSTGASYESKKLHQGKRDLPDIITNTKRTKSAGVSPQPRRQKIDESRKQFTKRRCFDDIDSVYLSSDCASSSSLPGKHRVSVSFHFSLDDKIVSWLANVAKNQEDTKYDHQRSSKKAKCSSEKNNKTCEESYESPELTLQSHDEKKVSFSLESEMSMEEEVAEIVDSKSKTVTEPLFWPFEQKFDWTPDDILKHFSISPRRKKSIGSKTSGTSPRSMRAQLQTRKLVLKEGCKRKLMFNGPGTSPKQARTIGNKKTKISSKNQQQQQQPIMKSLKRNKSLPASLKTSREEVPVQAAEESVEICKKTPKKLIMTRRSRTFVEDDFALMNDFSIENAVGLCEFRGREGIDSDFNTDGFMFED
ncbi:unnamed protein product [Eruca vesicaria subsp. sativa]|uniref:Uncharacterized protein n=1 Tax=Eruca vesicaria subsp. sativa TaxID=29727 RepID=A0ABC8KTX3_ERUVS|nr:unnamed protein product [Eruca vesicaria subsp. sativa]